MEARRGSWRFGWRRRSNVGESMPPARIPMRDAAEIRGVRERARWRAIAGEPVELFEGRGLEWTVVFEAKADSFKISPGFRTVHVTAVRDLAEFRDCVAPVSGRIEAMAVAGDECEIEARAMGIPYVCAPGEMQSPPLDWRHGWRRVPRHDGGSAMTQLGDYFRQNLAQTSDAPMGLEISRAEGSWLIASDGRRYLDFIAGIGVSALGHGNREVLDAIAAQARRHLHVMVYGEYVIESQVMLARRLDRTAAAAARARVFHQQRCGSDRMRAEGGAQVYRTRGIRRV